MAGDTADALHDPAPAPFAWMEGRTLVRPHGGCEAGCGRGPSSERIELPFAAMKCLGLIGGIGWESTATYYRILNESVRHRFGSLYTARLLINSLDFQEIDSLVKANRWNDAGAILADAARVLEKAGAEGVVICSNLMHYVAEHVEAAVEIPLLHLGDAVLKELRAARCTRVGLLGTRFTLEHDFLLERPRQTPATGRPRKPIVVVRPAERDLDQLDRIIYGEVCRGIVREASRETLLRLGRQLRADGSQAIVLGSSELGLLLKPDDFAEPILDSTEVHALAAARWLTDSKVLSSARSSPEVESGSRPPGKRATLPRENG